MGPIVYHTHFAVFIEAILPIALFLMVSEAGRSEAFLLVSAVLLTAVLVSASRGGLGMVCAEVAAVLVLSHLQKRETGRKIGLIALSLVGGHSRSGFDCRVRNRIGPVLFGALDRWQAAVRHVYPAHDRSASLDCLGARVLAGGISRLRDVRPWSHRQPGSLRLVAVDCRRGGASRVSYAFSCSLVDTAGAAVYLGSRRDRHPGPCRLRLPVFASGNRRVAYPDSCYGCCRSIWDES